MGSINGCAKPGEQIIVSGMRRVPALYDVEKRVLDIIICLPLVLILCRYYLFWL